MGSGGTPSGIAFRLDRRAQSVHDEVDIRAKTSAYREILILHRDRYRSVPLITRQCGYLPPTPFQSIPLSRQIRWRARGGRTASFLPALSWMSELFRIRPFTCPLVHLASKTCWRGLVTLDFSRTAGEATPGRALVAEALSLGIDFIFLIPCEFTGGRAGRTHVRCRVLIVGT